MNVEDIEIATTAIDATTRPELWDTLCDKIARRLQAQAFMLQEYNVEAHTTPVFHASVRMRTGEGGRILKEVVAGAALQVADRQGYIALARSKRGLVLGEARAFGFERAGPPPTNPFRDKILQATQSTSRSALCLNQIGPWMDVAITCDRQKGFGASKYLTEHAPGLSLLLQKTMESKRLIARLTKSYSALLDLFDRLKFGVAFCSTNGTLKVANEKMRFWLNENDALCRNQNRLEASMDTDKSAFRSAIGNAAVATSDARTKTLSLTRRSGKTAMVVHVTPVKDTDVQPETVVLVLALDPTEEQHICADGLATAGALTPAEVDICNLLLSGFDTSTVSKQRGTGVETVRGQVKSIMHKLECKRRVDLIRLAMITSPLMYLDAEDEARTVCDRSKGDP